ncbi:hypothetical protein A1O3_09766 [Capronia epimyces CBS 606.96]|uniref:Enoyl reductase (ER) domain-containing protein n=1 Tax=Capronia epimyces CBS 606.96 TaxID=1182542 RepID=W9Y509_9EURO|nr:uncharacterized protein A1O3_09766 [Capronia epimyces CBS 606.96]EXJ77539.1 hypothetical protein A1O3_09766 [Capronia epimyces CBS 606.96]
MSTHTVFRLASRDGFDGLKAFQEPMSRPGRGEVLVKVRSVGLNYRDIAIATSNYPLPVKDLVVPCSDMAGEVVQVGDDVVSGGGADEVAVGDAVVTPASFVLLYGPTKGHLDTLGGGRDGVLREYFVVPAHAVIKIPQSSSHSLTDWAAMTTTGATVWNAFYGHTPLKPGQTVLVQGTGGVALTALIFAKAAGATVIVTSSSDDKLDYVKAKYGADFTINYKTHPRWAAEVQRITNGRGADHVVDVGGAGTIEQSLEAVAWGGIVSNIGFLAGVPEGQMPNVALMTLVKGSTLRGILSGSKQQLEEAVRRSWPPLSTSLPAR